MMQEKKKINRLCAHDNETFRSSKSWFNRLDLIIAKHRLDNITHKWYLCNFDFPLKTGTKPFNKTTECYEKIFINPYIKYIIFTAVLISVMIHICLINKIIKMLRFERKPQLQHDSEIIQKLPCSVRVYENSSGSIAHIHSGNICLGAYIQC